MAPYPWLLGVVAGCIDRSSYPLDIHKVGAASARRMARLAASTRAGRRTIRAPTRRQYRVVAESLGSTKPRRPRIERRAGTRVSAASTATITPIEHGRPVVRKR